MLRLLWELLAIHCLSVPAQKVSNNFSPKPPHRPGLGFGCFEVLHAAEPRQPPPSFEIPSQRVTFCA